MNSSIIATQSVEEAIQARRSIRMYTDEPVSKETVEHIIGLASLAPSGSNVQPWRVVAVMGHEAKQSLMAVANNQKQVGGAAVVFVVYCDMEDAIANTWEVVHPGVGDNREERAKGLQDHFTKMGYDKAQAWGESMCFLFAGFLVLAAQASGYATSTMQGFDAEGVKKLLLLPEKSTVPVIIAMGRADEEGFSHHRHSVERITWFVD